LPSPWFESRIVQPVASRYTNYALPTALMMISCSKFSASHAHFLCKNCGLEKPRLSPRKMKRIWTLVKLNIVQYFFHIRTVNLDIIKVFYSPTDAQVNCLQKILKFTLKQLRHVLVQSHHHQGSHYSSLLKLQLLK